MVERDNLQDSDPTDVAWVEVSKFSGKQTFVEFYYAPHDPALHKSILSNSTLWLDEFDDPTLAGKLYSSAFPLVDVTVIPDDEMAGHRSMAAQLR